MAETDITKTSVSDLNIDEYQVDSQTTDGPMDQKETRYFFNEWSQWHGYYRKIPEMKAVIDAKARWTIGRGFEADEQTTMILDMIKGFGKDTFNSILENMHRTAYINGDSFAEIITDDEGILINLKPIDPGSMAIVANKKGMITKYEQWEKVDGKRKAIAKFTPQEIFHISRNRTADEIHGIPLAEGMEELIVARNEAITDWRKVLHRNVSPIILWKLDTDDQTEIDAFIAKTEAAREENENIYVPKGTVEPEVLTVAPNQTLNPLPWIDALNNYFFQAAGVPDVIIGGTQSLTEASAKIKYLAFQQNVEEDQLYLQEQILSQLNLVVELKFPASLENEALSAKDNAEKPTIQQNESAVEPNDQKMEAEGRK